jgi:hypothetical protein
LPSTAHKSSMSPSRRVTLATRLEQDRLHDRAARLDRVIAALRLRARSYDGVAPSALERSLSEFQSERASVIAQLMAHENAAERG